MEAREQMQRWIAWVVQHVGEDESRQIKADIDLFTGLTGRLAGELARRNTALASKVRSRNSKPPIPAPSNGPQKQGHSQSSTDTPKTGNSAQGRSQGLSRIQQGIMKAKPTIRTQKQALRRQTYGQPSQERSFQKAAKVLAS